MKWSQLKLRIESLFADAVRGRVELRTTRYAKAHDQMGRGWITIDGREIINMCSFAFEGAVYDEAARVRRATGCTDYRNPAQRADYHRAWDAATETVRARGVFSRHDLTLALFDYLNLSVDLIFSSPNAIIRAVGVLDRRVGRRRLAVLDVANEHPLVRTLYQFRCDAERFGEA